MWGGLGRDDETLSLSGHTVPNTAERQIPSSIGPYRIIAMLGEGGMGAVYEAEQVHPRRLVALKIIKAAWASPELLRRFDQESQALGRLHHPGIAQIYEAGSGDAGFGAQPYFAMELIRGNAMIEYATNPGVYTVTFTAISGNDTNTTNATVTVK